MLFHTCKVVLHILYFTINYEVNLISMRLKIYWSIIILPLFAVFLIQTIQVNFTIISSC